MYGTGVVVCSLGLAKAEVALAGRGVQVDGGVSQYDMNNEFLLLAVFLEKDNY